MAVWNLRHNRLGRNSIVALLAVSGILLASAASAAPPRSKSSKASKSTKSKEFTTGSSDVLIEFINKQVRQSWIDNEIAPSAVASDEEWLRRLYLDLVGTIPPADVVVKFSADRDKAKRSKMIETLLDDEAYVRNWTTIWTNLMIGQRTPRRVSRAGMQKFLREVFARNRPWNEVVKDIVTAEGHFEQNGAVNFLLAQMTMRDEQVQATAKTTRLFMGIQVQCTQCHNHPFNDWKQNQFWEFNSFFRQAQRIDHRKLDPRTGRRVDDYSELAWRNISDEGVFFEKRSGLIQVAYPKYFDKTIDQATEVDRRKLLGTLMIEGEKPFIALAFVNRMWGHFFGFGFTKPVDDMGPHKAPTHPELLDRIAEEFVKSRYDMKQVIRWICNSEAYNLTSKFNSKNEIDNPAAGETALFSHMYVKSMTAEQLYDSLIVATNAHKSGRTNWADSEQQRQRWLQQFVVAFGTDEGDESTTFNGTIPQALMLINGELTQNATSGKKGSFLNEVLSKRGSDATYIRSFWVSALNRNPTRRESQQALKMIRGSKNRLEAYQDLFWALLNSNEFIFVH